MTNLNQRPTNLSGLHYANRFFHAFLKGMEEVMGYHGVETTLTLAALNRYIQKPPSQTLDRDVDFTVFAAINLALDEMYSQRGGRGMALRAGRAWFSTGFGNFGALYGVSDKAFRALVLQERCEIGLTALTDIFNHFTDEHCTFESTDSAYHIDFEHCAMCYGKTADRPICQPIVGLLQEAMRYFSNGREFIVRESVCRATGADHCRFVINKQPL